ncbi:MAG: hypothetical protein HEQ35_31620 [Gloeotrichia echinulata IR180]
MRVFINCYNQDSPIYGNYVIFCDWGLGIGDWGLAIGDEKPHKP